MAARGGRSGSSSDFAAGSGASLPEPSQINVGGEVKFVHPTSGIVLPDWKGADEWKGVKGYDANAKVPLTGSRSGYVHNPAADESASGAGAIDVRQVLALGGKAATDAQGRVKPIRVGGVAVSPFDMKPLPSRRYAPEWDRIKGGENPPAPGRIPKEDEERISAAAASSQQASGEESGVAPKTLDMDHISKAINDHIVTTKAFLATYAPEGKNYLGRYQQSAGMVDKARGHLADAEQSLKYYADRKAKSESKNAGKHLFNAAESLYKAHSHLDQPDVTLLTGVRPKFSATATVASRSVELHPLDLMALAREHYSAPAKAAVRKKSTAKGGQVIDATGQTEGTADQPAKIADVFVNGTPAQKEDVKEVFGSRKKSNVDKPARSNKSREANQRRELRVDQPEANTADKQVDTEALSRSVGASGSPVGGKQPEPGIGQAAKLEADEAVKPAQQGSASPAPALVPLTAEQNATNEAARNIVFSDSQKAAAEANAGKDETQVVTKSNPNPKTPTERANKKEAQSERRKDRAKAKRLTPKTDAEQTMVRILNGGKTGKSSTK